MKQLIIIPADPSQDLRFHEMAKEPPLQMLQDYVDGHIELIPRWTRYDNRRCEVYCNEEGKLRNLPPNERATYLWWDSMGTVADVLCGDIVIVSSLIHKKAK